MSRKTLPAKTPEARENQLINLAFNLAEKKLKEGTASSQLITTLINMGCTKMKYEIEKLKSDLKVANAKIEAFEGDKNRDLDYAKVLAAFKSYQGTQTDEYDEDYDEEDF